MSFNKVPLSFRVEDQVKADVKAYNVNVTSVCRPALMKEIAKQKNKGKKNEPSNRTRK